MKQPAVDGARAIRLGLGLAACGVLACLVNLLRRVNAGKDYN